MIRACDHGSVVAPTQEALLKSYELAHKDHRDEVSLGWERQKFFLLLNPTILVTSGALTAISKPAAIAALAVGTVTAFAGALAVGRSHGRTRRTRDWLHKQAQRVGLEGPEITGGQRELKGKPRKERFRIVTLMIVALAVNSAFDAGLALYLGLHDEAVGKQETR